MSKVVDLLVLGGGPSGLAAAIAGRMSGLSVMLVEPHEGVVDKACGEGLLPHGLEALSQLGVTGFDGVPLVGVRYQVAGRPAMSAEADFPGRGALGIRRTSLHAALLARAEALGVRFVRDRARWSRQDDESVRLVSTGGGGDHRGRYLVAADGLRSGVRAALGLLLPPRRAPRFGVRRHFRRIPWSGRVEVTFAPGAEAYVTPVAHDVVGVALLFEEPSSFEVLLARFPELAARLDGAEPVSRTRGAGPFEQRVRARVAGRVLLVGDAAGYVDPLTGEGVALGLATSVAAVDSIARGAPEAYEARHRALTRRADALTSALLAVARRPLLHGALVKSARALPWAFEAALAALSGEGSARRHGDAEASSSEPLSPARAKGRVLLEATRELHAALSARPARA